MDLQALSILEEKAQGAVEDLLVETQKLIIRSDSAPLDIDNLARPSRSAPSYIKKLIDNPDADDEDTTTTTTTSTTPFDSTNTLSFEELQLFKRKLQDEDRLTNVYKLRHTFASRFDNRAWLHPHGTTNFDFKAIPKQRQEVVEEYKNRVRKENYMYLGSHPEIHAIISMLLKKLLNARPDDASAYLAEYFSTRLTNNRDFEKQLEDELLKSSRYHVTKMKNAGRINIKPFGEVHSEISGEEWLPELDANHFKKMNIGSLAADFSFDSSCLMSTKKKTQEEQANRAKKKKKKIPRKYCGCKDWKLKTMKTNKTGPTRPSTAETISTLGNVDTLRTSEEDETEEEEEEGELEEDLVTNLGPEVADRIASELVQSFFDLDEGAYYAHLGSIGAVTKNIL